jgi:hypothetical protein
MASAWFENASTNDLSRVVERAVVAPDISQIDPDRHPDLGLSAWDFIRRTAEWYASPA